MEEVLGIRADGLFLRREAISLGVSDKDLREGLRSHRLVRIRQGAYVEAGSWQRSNDVERHLLRSRAVLLTHGDRAALSHVSGAIAHGVRVWGADLDRVHVVRLDGQSGRSTHDVVHHTNGWSTDDVVDARGLTVLSAEQCLVGLASTSSVESGVVAVDSAYDLGLTTEGELRSVVAQSYRWPGTARLQVTMRLARTGAQSVGESRLRHLCWRGHLPPPVLQYDVRDARGHLIGTTDFAWPEHGVLGEFDGRIKYGRLLRPGERPEDVVFREKVREDELREATGWTMIRFIWADLDNPRRSIDRLSRALLRSAGV